MGVSSWLTADTFESIRVDPKRGSQPIKMLAPDGREWLELAYEGYCRFGGKDYFELVAELNGYTWEQAKEAVAHCCTESLRDPARGMRNYGLDLYFDWWETRPLDFGKAPVLPRLVTAGATGSWSDYPINDVCPRQGCYDEEE